MQFEKLKRYEKLSFLGEGQVRNIVDILMFNCFLEEIGSNWSFKFATVYKSRDRETGLIVAVKKVIVNKFSFKSN